MNKKSKTTNNKTVKKKSNSKSLKNDLLETKDKYLRLYSEFENYRRRTSKEKVEMINSANKELISLILPVIDDFERAIKLTSKENLDPFVGFIRDKFQQAETARLYDEKRWLKAYRNYRGLYGPEMAFRDNEKSKVFVKITKTKVLAAFGQIIEVLFSSGKFPIGVRPTTVPEGIDEYAHITKVGQPQQANGQAQPNGQDIESPYGFAGDGGELPKGATAESLMKDLSQQYKNLDFEEGPSPDNKTMPQIEPADMAAGKMQKLIHDQLEESEAITILRHVFFEMCLLGTGILKGPFTTEKTQYYFVKIPKKFRE